MKSAFVKKPLPSRLKALLCTVAVGFLVVGAACSPEQSLPGPGPLLLVNGEAISKQEFLASFDRTMHAGEQLSEEEKEELQRTFLVQLIDRQLIYAEAKRLNISVTPTEVQAALADYRKDYPDGGFDSMLKARNLTLQDWQTELEEGLIMEKLLEQVVYAPIEVREEEIAEYYVAHKEEFNRPAQVRVRQIVVMDREEGLRLIGRLRQGEDFASLAEAFSISPEAQQGGDLGFFGRGEMPSEFDAVVFDLPVGRLSDLVKSDYGYHIFLVEERRSASRLDKKEAFGEIESILQAQKREDVYQEWLQTLRAQAAIEVDWAQLDTTLQN